MGVIPTRGPRLQKSKPIAAIPQARISADQNRLLHREIMFAAKIAMNPFLRDSAAAWFAKPKLPVRLMFGHRFLRALRRTRGATLLLAVPRLSLSPALLLSLGLLLFFRLRLL